MDSPHPNPRRRNISKTPSTATDQHLYTSTASSSAQQGHSLKKSSTFHSPSTPPSIDYDPILSIPSLPRRSPTCPQDLETAIAAGDNNRLANIIGAVHRSLEGLESFSSNSQDTLVTDGHPVPLFIVGAHVARTSHAHANQESTPTDSSRSIHKHHTSDSGIGSTVSSFDPSMSNGRGGIRQARVNGMKSPINFSLHEGRVQTGINGLTASAAASGPGIQHALSEYACRQIQKHIIVPIIREEKLKEFHPLVTGIPYRVARKEITCLRDLEKVLLWLAPKWSVSKTSFLNFCETSIQCIHTTISYLNETDQRRPGDRPYTNGYFLDLTEQVRQFATMIANARARTDARTSGQAGSVSLDPSLTLANDNSDERLGLVGGLSQTGRPAELVRIEDGRSILLRTGEEVSAEHSSQHGMKRLASEESDDDVERSMALRRRSAQPAIKEIPRCNECDKTFKRPCDLTKHEKTHSRPWKCNEVDCKYHEYGWPTEKERDRHMNDKHSAAPSMFSCHYPPCTYESKRESNCKQHMEKAHGWTYVRSKNNGKNAKKPQTGKTPPTPQMSTPGSCIFDVPTPDYTEGQLGEPSSSHHRSVSLDGSVVASEASLPYGSDDQINFDETFGPFDPATLDEAGNNFNAPNLTDYDETSNRQPWDSSALPNSRGMPSTFESSLPLQDEEPLFGDNFDWPNMDRDFTSLNIQLITPATSVQSRALDTFSRNASVTMEQSPMMPQLSPGAQGDAMLYSPYSMHSNEVQTDEGFGDYIQEFHKPTQDFPLFENSNMGSSMNMTANEGMFQDLPPFSVPSAWSGRGTDLAHQLGMADMMHTD